MRHALLESLSAGLSAAGIACLRYQFPYMERASRRPDPPPVCHASVRSAVLEAARLTSAPLIAGGRSFGGRMSSQAQALAPLPKVQGLAFIGFPLHTAHHPTDDRAQHLFEVRVPMLFLQGTQDELAELTLLAPLVKRLGEHTTLELFEHANHAFHVPKRSGHTDAEILDELIGALARWIFAVTASA
jgi:predicted alpha/beta-hydrolase family hydrolase